MSGNILPKYLNILLMITNNAHLTLNGWLKADDIILFITITYWDVAMLPFININIDGLVKSLKEYQQAQYIVVVIPNFNFLRKFQ